MSGPPGADLHGRGAGGDLGRGGAGGGLGGGGAGGGLGGGGEGGGLGGGGEGGDESKTFEQLLAELEGVTDRLAGGELGIEAATDLYERAERLHALAAARLAQVQERVDRLRADGASSAP
jgi:exodeoxyribonuclease VII small subunit